MVPSLLQVESNLRHRLAYASLSLITLLLANSCSLVKIESEQKPLEVRELNTRLLTQNFARTALDRVTEAADSIFELASAEKEVQTNTLYWKIQTSKAIGDISFQTEPKIALMDTWAYFLETHNALRQPEMQDVFRQFNPIAVNAIEKNIEDIETIAAKVLSPQEYRNIKDFVYQYANDTPLTEQKQFKHRSIRESYLKYKDIPDSTAVQTVGTLSEVVADATNRFGYYSDVSGKRLQWKTELMLHEKGIDSMDIEAKIAEIDRQFERLLTVAENSPETIEDAIVEFRNTISPLFSDLNNEIGYAMRSLSSDLESIDTMLYRERLAVDAIIQREREALSLKADALVESSISNVFDSVERTLKQLMLYFALFLIIILGLPFYLGYLAGKRSSKSK